MKINNREVILICKKMSILLNSGYEITKSLYLITYQFSKKTSKIITQIANHIQNGNTITESFQSTKSFSKFFISMLMAGEVSGNIDEVMEDLSEYYDKDEKIKSKIINIAAYPAILMIVSIFTMLFILIYVVPSFEMLFLNTEMEVPFLTKILMYASKIVRENGLYLVLVGVILISLIVMIVNSNGKVKYFKDKLKVTIPLIREVNILIYTTRFGKALYLLIKSGVHIIDAIDISSKVVDNQFIYEKLIISKDSIEQGNSIHHSIKKASVFPKLFVSMIEIGEESGGLEESLSSMSNFYSQELDLKIDNITKVGQPVLTVFVGLFVGLFIIAMIMPIFDAVNAI